jgi:hypothetical protein
MPFPNEHAARIKDPKQFDDFARKNIKPGIDIILGIKEGISTAQSYRFKKDKFTIEQAKQWLKDNDIQFISFEAAIQAFRENVFLFCSKLQAFSQNDILNLIPKSVLEEIKENDQHPYFQLYSLCHEGTSQPKLLGKVSRPIFWPRTAIQSIKNVITKGIKLFKKHNKDNSTDNRESFGEVVHSFEKEIDGKLHHCVITYHTENQKSIAKQCDVISQEAEWNFIESAGRLIADTIEKLTGIAGENSQNELPAFALAKRLAFVQAFETKTGDVMSDDMNNLEERITKKTRQISFHEWRAMKDVFAAYPHQVFTEEEMKHDKEFGKLFSKVEKLEAENKQLKEQYENDTKKFSDEINNYKRKNYENSAKTRLIRIMEENNYTEKMKTVIEKAYDKQKDKVQDLSDEGLTSFANIQKENFQTFMNLLDEKIDDQQPPDETKGENEKDFTKAEDNEFLTEDIDFDV